MFTYIDTETDELVPVQTLCRRQLGRPVTPQTVWRWVHHGVRGARLEAVRACGVWCSTPHAFGAFLEAQTAAALVEEGRTDE